MIAQDVHTHFLKIGHWVDWSSTTDGFHFGDPGTEVSGIAVGWKPYWGSLRRAHDLGCNLFVSHESIFREGRNGDETETVQELERPKLGWLQETGMVVYRCHDVWDVMPEVGVVDSWAAGLGFRGAPLAQVKYYRVEDVSGRTFGQLCRDIADRVRGVGQEGVLAVGDPGAPVTRLALGTGAITKVQTMLSLNADVCVVCDDYFRTVRDGALLQDLGVPYLIVNHGAKEEWGIANLHAHVQGAFADVPVHFIAQGCAYRIVASG